MANLRPNAIYAITPRSLTSISDGYRKITYRELANAVNSIAWMLHDQLGPGKEETIAYLGMNDLGYIAIILGAVKAGYKLLLISPRNTIQDHISLFMTTDCKTLLTPKVPPIPPVAAILTEYPMQVIHTPILAELLRPGGTTKYFLYPKTFAEARSEALVVVHTSGTTATPKPIVYTHDFAGSYIQWGQLVQPPGFESQVSLVQSNRLFVTLPFFHAGNLYVTLFDAIANQSIVVTPLAGVMPSAQVVADGLKLTPADGIVLAPPFVEQIAKSPELLQLFTDNLDTITYGGGDISQTAGDAIATRTRLYNFNGSTETGSFPLLRPSGPFSSEDWKSIHPHPSAGIEFRPSTDGLYEAFIVKNAEFEDEQPVFKLFPHLNEYPTKDLFSKHPSKPDLWTYYDRADDILVFKQGYLCNPIAMEHHVQSFPHVRDVLMAGTGRYQSSLLIELDTAEAPSESLKQEMLEKIWPVVEKANEKYPQGARVAQSHI
ncbi:hypothetical protein MMC25_003537 [Agyrium rufum]|nr:hypothetical protein [Agyrium rufum]